MTNLPPETPTRTMPAAETEVMTNAAPEGRRSDDPSAMSAEPAQDRPAARRPASPQWTALVVLAAMGALAVAFIVLMVVGVTNESINALAVFATPIASMVAAYYGITFSMQQVKSERAERERALERVDAALTAGRETEIWAAQMESALRVAMAKLNAARLNTDEVTRAAGTPDGFF